MQGKTHVSGAGLEWFPVEWLDTADRQVISMFKGCGPSAQSISLEKLENDPYFHVVLSKLDKTFHEFQVGRFKSPPSSLDHRQMILLCVYGMHRMALKV
ncbi:hypothetical protein ACFQ3K_09675 [Brucella gallinifaecis]|uniref:Uncharacterized protein n=1 Tax=Brucella gallinifaecis TaxID=215590 RepID=A0A502BRJ0_9HYPH|nr:hypothetical protein [Brucella gallinifaecis]TPF76834.1 hypothetical protein FHY56_00200 [Brucella gallinifaecis]